MPLSPKKTAAFIALLVIAGIATYVMTQRSQVVIAVTTTRPVRRDLSSWISSNGEVEPIERQVIQAKLTTFVQSISVKEGQSVTAGQLLMTLDAKDLETELARLKEQLVASEEETALAASGGDPQVVAELRGNLAKLNSEITRLQAEGESLQRLYSKQAATKQEIDQNHYALVKAEADKRATEEKLADLRNHSNVQGERARLRTEQTNDALRSVEEKLKSASVKASAAGTIYALPVRPGMFVHEGDTLAELADLSRIRVRIFVDEPDLGSLQQGQSVEITWDGLPNHVWNGHLAQLPKTIVSRGARKVGEVLCSVDDASTPLLPHTDVYARIRTGERDKAIALPRGAVRTEGNKHYVFVVENGRVHKQEIGIGISSSTDYEILSGITEKDTIALPGSLELHDGEAVNVS